MKFIKLECSTRGEKSGAILPVGGEGEISVEEAQILVAEKMAAEYVAPSTGGSNAELEAELASANEELEELRKGKVGELKASVKELEAQVKTLTEQNQALTDQVALFTASGE